MINSSGFIHKKPLSKNKKFHFPAKIDEIQQTFYGTKFFISESYKLPGDYLFIGAIIFVYQWEMLLKMKTFGFQKRTTIQKNYISFHLFIKNVFMKIKNLICPPKYTRYGANVRWQNFLIKKGLQLWSGKFIHRSFIFRLLMKNTEL